jgi:hypothetical protein
MLIATTEVKCSMSVAHGGLLATIPAAASDTCSSSMLQRTCSQRPIAPGRLASHRQVPGKEGLNARAERRKTLRRSARSAGTDVGVERSVRLDEL